MEPLIKTMIISDEILLKQIFLNLNGNAAKFTNEGTIYVRAKVKDSSTDKIQLAFEIEDAGIGIEQDKINIIFNDFTQADDKISNSYGGTSLGLVITKKIIGLLGEDIMVKSSLGLGSKFSFDLWFENTNEDLKSVSIQAITKGNLKNFNGKISIVEDNQLNQKYISKLMEKWDISYIIANHGKEAIDFLC